MKTNGWGLALGALMLSAAWPAEARTVMFEHCDGYGTPTSDGDGMTKEATVLFGLIGTLGSAGNTRRSTPVLGEQGIQNCDQALGDARLTDKHWLRRASLLRARAVHNLALGRPDEALADLDRATAAVRTPDDPFIKRSIVLGIRFVRGAALAMKGNHSDATKIVGEIETARPFDRRVGLASIAVLGDDRSVFDGLTLAQSLARLDPRVTGLMYTDSFNRADFKTVVELYPHIKAFTRTGDIGVSRAVEKIQDAVSDREEIKFGAESAGRLAYAFAALGRMDEARSVLSKARNDLKNATPAPIPNAAVGVKEGWKARLNREIADSLIAAAKISAERLDGWERSVVLRGAIETEEPAKAAGLVQQAPVMAPGVALDMLRVMQRRLPEDQELKTVLASVEAKNSQPAQITNKEAKLLFESLPHTEVGKRVATYKKRTAIS